MLRTNFSIAPWLFASFLIMVIFSCEKDNVKLIDDILFNYYTYQGNIGAVGTSTILSNDNNILICGNSGGQPFVLKISKQGFLKWRKPFSGLSAKGIIQTPFSELFVCGSDHKNIGLVKMDSKGNTIWSKSYPSVRWLEGERIINSEDGNLIIVGKTHLYDSIKEYDLVIMKVNSDGLVLWERILSTEFNEFPTGILQLHDGNYLVTSTRSVSGKEFRIHLLSFDDQGILLWEKEYGPTNRSASTTIEAANGDLVICGFTGTFGTYESNALVMRCKNNGELIWKREYGDNEYTEAASVLAENSEGDFIVAGAVSKPLLIDNGSSLMAFKINGKGDLQWCKYYIGEDYNGFTNIAIDETDVSVLTGYSQGQIIMVRLDKNGEWVF